MTRILVLTLPIEDKEYTIHNDASSNGLGFMLMQDNKVTVFAFKQLKLFKRIYPTLDLELAVVVFALKIWRHYPYEMPCKIYTNHPSLKYIFIEKEIN